MKFTLNIWRQNGPHERGRFIRYEAQDVSPGMSFLEMLDGVNQTITPTAATTLRSPERARERRATLRARCFSAWRAAFSADFVLATGSPEAGRRDFWGA